jgi:hypothetical protein
MNDWKYRQPTRRDTKIIGRCRICNENIQRFEIGDVCDMPKALLADHETHVKAHKSCIRDKGKIGLLDRSGRPTNRRVDPKYAIYKKFSIGPLNRIKSALS